MKLTLSREMQETMDVIQELNDQLSKAYDKFQELEDKQVTPLIGKEVKFVKKGKRAKAFISRIYSLTNPSSMNDGTFMVAIKRESGRESIVRAKEIELLD